MPRGTSIQGTYWAAKPISRMAGRISFCRVCSVTPLRWTCFQDYLADPFLRGAALCGADRVELYTAAYAEEFKNGPEKAVEPYLRAALAARECSLGLNAGHDLNLDNLAYFIRTIPWTDEVSIGHAIICDALYMGLERTIGAYLEEIQKK